MLFLLGIGRVWLRGSLVEEGSERVVEKHDSQMEVSQDVRRI